MRLNIKGKLLMETDMVKEKKPRGRPQLYPSGTEVVAFRVPVEIAAVVKGAIARITLANQDTKKPDGLVLLEALRARLRSLENRPGVQHTISLLDQKVAEFYPRFAS